MAPLLSLIGALLAVGIPLVSGLNRPPSFLPGGDMQKFSLSEDTPVGTIVYTLKGWDPEGGPLSYYISGGPLAVAKRTGEVQLVRPLDRETEPVLDVIISVADEPSLLGEEPNTISFKREIMVLDVNDNVPTFLNTPYDVTVSENVPPGSTVYRGIIVTDPDLGANSEVRLSCLAKQTPEGCAKFAVMEVQVGEGRFQGEIILKETVDYEARRNYTMALLAEDRSAVDHLNSTAYVTINIRDVQDQPPVFLNAPFSAMLVENSPPNRDVMTILAQDGDRGEPRELVFSLIDETKDYFYLETKFNAKNGAYEAVLKTSSNPVDREDPEILNSGGIYTFQIKAQELVEGYPKGASILANVTIVVNDVNDQIPEFDQKHYNVTIPEDAGLNSPIAGLNIMVIDKDAGENAKFKIYLEGQAKDIFSIVPTNAVGKTPLILKVKDPTQLDYEDPGKRLHQLKLVAVQENGVGSSTAQVSVWVTDVNDNSPIFENDQFLFQVPENTPSGTDLFSLRAYDLDSGIFGQITYSLKGFSSNKFVVEADTGMVSIAQCSPTCLDYESEQSYSLTYVAQDGGGRMTTVNLFIEVLDVNDNAPVFAQDEYFLDLTYNTKKLSPPLFIKATDVDTGPGGQITYSLRQSPLTPHLSIHPQSGALSLSSPIPLTVPQGVYTIMVEAWDQGETPLSSATKLIVQLEAENSGAPLFLNEPYEATIPENTKEGTSILKVSATGPSVSYLIESGAKDNFILEKETGILRVAPGATLDRELSGTKYHIKIQAADELLRSSVSSILVHVKDVNNKPPSFQKDTYSKYLSENTPVNSPVLTVSATDPDLSAKLHYSIVEPIEAQDRSGAVVVASAKFDYKNAFKIDPSTGVISTVLPLDYNAASVIILKVKVEDLNAIAPPQDDTAEVTFYIESGTEEGPVFAPPWSPTSPVIEATVPEEVPVGAPLLTLSARDPLSPRQPPHFRKIPTEQPVLGLDGFIVVHPTTGVVTATRRLDYETLPVKTLKMMVAAIAASDAQRYTTATVAIHVQDINDNSPQFSQDGYEASIPESSTFPEPVLTVQATDLDMNYGFGDIQYSLSGDGSNLFNIHPTKGKIFVRAGAQLDRETQSSYNLVVTAQDNPEGRANQRRTSVLARITLLDVNDNPPEFVKSSYSAVIPENIPPNSTVLTVQAIDRDIGPNGNITYSLVPDYNNLAYFGVNPLSGAVKVIRSLAGKGRKEPYVIVIRATDQGDPPLFTDVSLAILVGDVSANDGVPHFIRPAAGEVAYVHENATIHTSVFQVVAYDPDNPNTPSGKVVYKFLDESQAKGFSIEHTTGIIQTTAPLDREERENYTVIVVAHDLGMPPQEAHAILHILVLDVNDNKPFFKKPQKDQLLTFTIKEELPLGAIVGQLEAYDMDAGDNAKLIYHITEGNENETFGMHDMADGKGEIFTKKRMDRESRERYLITVVVANEWLGENYSVPFDPNNPAMIRVAILVEDIDDHPPQFDQASYAIGVRVNTEVETVVLRVHAFDPDTSSSAVRYTLHNTTFHRPPMRGRVVNGVFDLNSGTGEISTQTQFWDYLHGYFDLTLEARSSPDGAAFTKARIHILQDRDLLKFIFYKRPTEIRNDIPKFQKEIPLALSQPISVNVYDTQFYSREDGSLDFESTSSCFHVLSGDILLDPKEVYSLLDTKKSSPLEELFRNYSIIGIENCIPEKAPYRMSWSQILILVVAGFIAIMAFVVSVIVCFMYNRYKKNLRKPFYPNLLAADPGVALAARLTPADHQRIYEWQELNTPLATDAMSFRSYPPTLR